MTGGSEGGHGLLRGLVIWRVPLGGVMICLSRLNAFMYISPMHAHGSWLLASFPCAIASAPPLDRLLPVLISSVVSIW